MSVVGLGAVDPDAARRVAEDILTDPRFHPRRSPRPFAGFFERLGELIVDPVIRFFRSIGNLLPEVGSPAWVALALAVILAAVVLMIRLSNGRGRQQFTRGGGSISDEEGLDPDELERRAEEAERHGDLDRALRLRFRAGLVRLDEAGVVRLRPGLTNSTVGRALRSRASTGWPTTSTRWPTAAGRPRRSTSRPPARPGPPSSPPPARTPGPTGEPRRHRTRGRERNWRSSTGIRRKWNAGWWARADPHGRSRRSGAAGAGGPVVVPARGRGPGRRVAVVVVLPPARRGFGLGASSSAGSAVHVDRLRGDLDSSPLDPAATVVVLDAPGLTDAEAEALGEFVRARRPPRGRRRRVPTNGWSRWSTTRRSSMQRGVRTAIAGRLPAGPGGRRHRHRPRRPELGSWEDAGRASAHPQPATTAG